MRILKITFICGILAASLAVVLEAFAGIAPLWNQWAGAILLGFGLAWTTVQIHSLPLKIVIAAVALVETAVLSWLLHLGGIQWMPWTALTAGTLATGFGMAYSMSQPGRRKRMVEEVFGGCISCVTFQKILDSDEPVSFAGEKREASVVDCQLFNCRELAGTLSAPDFMALVNEFSQAGAQALMNSGGVLTESNGERLRALFGAPLADPAHAFQAHEAALALEERLKKFREACRERWSVEPDYRVCVHSGTMIVGVFGIEPLGGFGAVATGETASQ